MSGLAASISFGGGDPADDINRMVDAVPHRCLAGSRKWESDGAALAHLCTHGPAESENGPDFAAAQDGSVAVAADARIDNRDELASRLSLSQDQLAAATDADLILAAYLEWGVAAAEQLLGDFAFVIWDTHRRRLYAARDPMALRPLYFRVEPRQRVLCASEAQQILAAADVPRRINETAVARHLLNRFDPLDLSFYEGIEILAPAHSLVVDESGKRVWRHWDFDPANEIRYGSLEDYVEHFRKLVIESVRARVSTGQPIGVLLSGGLDSGSAAGVAGWLREQGSGSVGEIRAYTWDFGDLKASDERHVSRHLIEHFDLPETEIPASRLGPLAEYPRHGPHIDTPFLGAFQPAIEKSLEVAAGEGCRLVMSGDRGDLVAGAQIVSYPRLLRTGDWRQLVTEIRRHHRILGDGFGAILLHDLLAPVLRRLRRGRWFAEQSAAGKYPTWLTSGFIERVGATQGFGEVEFGGASIDDVFREERRHWILEPMHMRGVMWTERTHAAYGLGFVDPWSDRRLAEFVVAVPPQVINEPGRNDKQLTKRAMEGVLPDSFLSTARKIVPTPLYERGLFENGSETVRSLFSGSLAAAHGFVDSAAVLAAYEQARGGGPDTFPIWRAICVEMWLRAHWAEA
jgi:asparagine synthase (glutamine-hydrolysing)